MSCWLSFLFDHDREVRFLLKKTDKAEEKHVLIERPVVVPNQT